MTPRRKTTEGLIFILIAGAAFGFLGVVMGPRNMINTIFRTAHDLLLNTVFYLLAITVLVGCFSALLIEFGVVGILEKILKPVMGPLFGLPGSASLGAVLCFLSDNPAILSLTRRTGFRAYYTKRQLYSLTNFGTAFGMGLIVITFMIGQGFYAEAGIGFAGACVGAIVSTRLMQAFTRKLGSEPALSDEERGQLPDESDAPAKKQSVFIRFLNASLDGGKSGLDAGLAILPGVLIIATAVMMLTWGPKDAAAGYQGLPYEGVPVLPALGRVLALPFRWLFGFTAPEAIAFPITSLGAVGAALGLVPQFLKQGLIAGNDIAVYTAMGMCWSGFLSTHTAMLDSMGRRDLVGKAVASHTIGGLAAGAAAHYLYLLVHLIL